MKQIALLVLGLIFIVEVGNAQKKAPDYGEDSIKCLRNLSLYTEFYNQKNYADAYKPWRTTVEICPGSNKNIYIHGATMFKITIRKEKDPAVKEQYIDSLMWLYNRRIEHFGQEGYVLGRKGVDLFRLNNEKFEEAYDIINKSVELRGNKSEVNTLVYWLQTAVLKFQADENHRETVLNNYSKAIDILDYQLKKETKAKKIQKIEDGIKNLEEIFSKSKAPDCDALIALFTPKFEAAPEAIEQQTDSLLLSKYYYELATLTHAKGGMSQTARSYAYKAIANNPNDGNPYLLIGRIYAGSSKECGENEFEQKAVYWASVDKFKKAKAVDPSIAEEANKEIMTYSQYFPNTEEAFFL
jgi:tetratricopeptide (TPR) repeat protein